MLPKITIAAVITVLVSFFGYQQFFAPIVISSDTTLAELKVPQSKSLVVKNGAKVIVTGDTFIAGKVESDQDLVLVAQGALEFAPSAEVRSQGNIQIVDSVEHIATGEKLETLYEEIAMDTNDGKFRIGPLLPDKAGPAPSQGRFIKLLKDNGLPYKIEGNKVKYQLKKPQGFNLVGPVNAAGKPDVKINGRWVIPTPPPGVNHIVFFNFPGRSVELNGSITGPNGRDGLDVSDGCLIDIPEMEYQDGKTNSGKKNKEKDALRTRIRSGTVIFGDFTLNLGNGGRGGNATTDNDCDPGIAIAGTGGKSSNLKVTAETEIIITKSFVINPGKGGQGGKATAYGKKGEPGKQGAAAFALGGYGADNIKLLKTVGQIKGLDKLTIGPVVGGDGGDGLAVPGDGGEGNVCDAKGSPPGEGYAEGGLGGIGKVTLPPGPLRTGGADGDGRDGANTVTPAKSGQDGPPCADNTNPPLPPARKIPEPSPSPDSTNIPKSVAPPKTSWEFLNTSDGYTKVASIKLANQGVHFIVASNGNPDVRTLLPITLVLKVDGKVEWTGKIDGDPKLVCRDQTGCSVDGPTMKSEWKDKSINLTATSGGGQVLATYTE